MEQKMLHNHNFVQNMWLLEAICERNLCEEAGHVKRQLEMIAVEFEPMQLVLWNLLRRCEAKGAKMHDLSEHAGSRQCATEGTQPTGHDTPWCKKCISRESNPGHIDGNDVFYH